jgi:hypothetical protein
VFGRRGGVVVTEGLPLGELVVEQLCVVDDDAVEQAVELLGVDPVGAFHLAVEPWGCGFDVAVADPQVLDVPVERRLKFDAVVCLDRLYLEREPGDDVVGELDRGLLVVAVVDPQHPQPGCSRRWRCTGSTSSTGRRALAAAFAQRRG